MVKIGQEQEHYKLTNNSCGTHRQHNFAVMIFTTFGVHWIEKLNYCGDLMENLESSCNKIKMLYTSYGNEETEANQEKHHGVEKNEKFIFKYLLILFIFALPVHDLSKVVKACLESLWS